MTNWRKHAACRGMPTEIFFQGNTANARLVCAKCTVTKECRDDAEQFERQVWWRAGVWGATSVQDRDTEFPINSRHAPVDAGAI